VFSRDELGVWELEDVAEEEEEEEDEEKAESEWLRWEGP